MKVFNNINKTKIHKCNINNNSNNNNNKIITKKKV